MSKTLTIADFIHKDGDTIVKPEDMSIQPLTLNSSLFNDVAFHQCDGLYDARYLTKGFDPETKEPTWWLEHGIKPSEVVTKCPECGMELK